MPIWNWEMLSKLNDLSYMLITDDYSKINGVNFIELRKIYNELEATYLTEFMLKSDYFEIINLQKEAIGLRIDAILTGDKTLNVHATLSEKEIDLLSENKKSLNLNESIAILEKYLGFPLDEKKLSVKKYFTYIDMLIKENKEKNKHVN